MDLSERETDCCGVDYVRGYVPGWFALTTGCQGRKGAQLR